MQYFYQDANNTEQGPLDENEILKLAAAGTIRRDTQVRTTLLKNCRDAEKFAFLTRFFAANNGSGESQTAASSSKQDSFHARFNVKEHESSAFVQHNRPKSAALTSRIGALTVDLLIFALLALVIFLPIQYLTRTVELVEVEEVEEIEEVEELEAKPAAPETAAPVKPQAPAVAASSEDNGIVANVNRASSGSSSVYGKVMDKARGVRDLNDKHNKDIERAMNDGKEPKAKKTSKSKKPQSTTPKSNPPPAKANPAAPPTTTPAVTPDNTPPPPPPKIEERLEGALKATKKKFNEFSIFPIEYSDSAIIVTVSNHETHTYDRAKLEPLLHTGFWIWMVAVFLYYSLTLGYYAQTVGMWYCGIFIAKNNIKEVYYLRAMLYGVALVLTGVLMIPSVLLTRRSVAEWITGVRVIHVYGAKN